MYTVDLNWQDYEIEDEEIVDGETVLTPSGIKMQLKSLSYEENQTFMTFSTVSNNGEAGSFNPDKMPKLLDFVREVLPEHVRNLSGLQMIDEGETKPRPVTIKDVVTHGCFLQLAMTIFRKLSNLSSMSKEDSDSLKKNLPGSSETM